MKDTVRVFTPAAEGFFVARPNRFTVYVDTPRGIIIAHCANPGRMEELLTPGARLILEKATGRSRRTDYTLVAARYEGKIVPIHAARANRIARDLLIPLYWPDTIAVEEEPRTVNGRFDFRIRNGQTATYIEVKSCSLVEEQVALFPDAPTLRGKRHVEDLARIAGTHSDVAASVLFVINHPDARAFVPNIHTDPELGLALARSKTAVSYNACSIRCDEAGYVSVEDPHVPIVLAPVECVSKNSGAYLLCIEIGDDISVRIGALGDVRFRRGWYVYVGSAMGTLSSRVARHLRKRKALRWHVDYLLSRAESVKAFPIYSGLDLECEISKQLERVSAGAVPRFGSSDCGCTSHLFRFRTYPLDHAAFRAVLSHFRHRRAFEPELADVPDQLGENLEHVRFNVAFEVIFSLDLSKSLVF